MRSTVLSLVILKLVPFGIVVEITSFRQLEISEPLPEEMEESASHHLHVILVRWGTEQRAGVSPKTSQHHWNQIPNIRSTPYIFMALIQDTGLD